MMRQHLSLIPVPSSHRQAGLTLVELMVAMAISLLLVAGMATLIGQQSGTRSELDKSDRQLENGRYAALLLRDDIQHAGFYGQYAGGFAAPTTLPDPCAITAVSIDASLAVALQGYDAPVTVPSPLSACLPDADHIPGTDILVVRRLEAVEVLPVLSSAAAGQVYIQTTPDAKVTAIGPDPQPATPTVYTLVQKDAVTAAELRKYVQHVYFLSPCNVYASGQSSCTSAADGGQPVPTLKRLELTASSGATSITTVPLVEGIQNLQFDYGVDSTGDGTPGTPYLSAPGVADWPNVMVVQINLLVRTVEPSGGYDGSGKTYNLGLAGTVGPFTDAFKRHVFSLAVRVFNQSGPRE